MASHPPSTIELAEAILARMADRSSEQKIVQHIKLGHPISRNANTLTEVTETFWDRLADRVAQIGGSWPFIGICFVFLAGWAVLNSFVLTRAEAFDPYPYIFLNLVLSMLAAIQAPVIMMSQNRQAEKDRIAAANDYEVNLRSEIEILAMQHKLDHLRGEQHELILRQQREMLAILRRLEIALSGGDEFSDIKPNS